MMVDSAVGDGYLNIRGSAFKAKVIGEGAASIAMVRVGDKRKDKDVFVYTPYETEDEAKEIIVEINRDMTIAHIPVIQVAGYTSEGVIYKMPFYRPVQGASKSVKTQIKRLQGCIDSSWRGDVQPTCPSKGEPPWVCHGEAHRTGVIACAKAAGLSKALVKALVVLSRYAKAYSPAYSFEFPDRNLAIDARGGLILLDVVFDIRNVWD